MTNLIPPDIQSPPKTDVFGSSVNLFNKMNGGGENSNKIYIARNPQGYTLSIVVASVQREAEIFWQGKGIIAFSVEVIDPSRIDTPLGFIEILKTRTIRTQEHGSMSKEIVVVDKK